MGAAWFACTGDAPGLVASTGDSGAVTGDRLGPCFGDGTCKQGLVCRNGEICLTPDEPAPQDAGNARQDAGDAGPETLSCAQLGEAGEGRVCARADGTVERCMSAQKCCMGTGCFDRAQCPSGSPQWVCANKMGCVEGASCVVLDTVLVPTDAGCASLDATESMRREGTTCSLTVDDRARELCTTDTDCSDRRRCRPVTVFATGGHGVTVGICVAP